MTDHMNRAGLPASLSDADAFAALGPRPNPSRTPVLPADDSGARFLCPCTCNCGNDTSHAQSDVTSPSAARHLRCGSCAAESHFGPRWNPTPNRETTGTSQHDEIRTGSRTGRIVAVRRHVPDPEEQQWHREAAEQLEAERRNTARDRWLSNLPERWQLPYDQNEALVPEVADRLNRLQKNQHVGTSLLCIGPFGSGKTWVAYTYARAAVDRRLLWPSEVRIGTEAEIVEPLANAGFRIAEEMGKLFKPTLKMLIIDDVGSFSAYRNQQERWAAFGKIVDWMYVHRRALVITTNKSLGTGAELEQWIGLPAYERIKSMAGEKQVFRDENKRGEMTALWESEYQAMRGGDPHDS